MIALLLITTSSVSAAQIDQWVRGDGPLPALVDVQQAAERALDLPDSDEVDGWPVRARWRGLVPRVDLWLGTDRALDVRDALAASSSRTLLNRRGDGVDLRLRFDLNELVYSPEELGAARVALQRQAAIQAHLERVTDVYFARLRLLIAEPNAETRLRAAELDGQLSALTGGWYRGSP